MCGSYHFLKRDLRKTGCGSIEIKGEEATDPLYNLSSRHGAGTLPETPYVWRDRGCGGCKHLQWETNTLDPFCLEHMTKFHTTRDGWTTTAVEVVMGWSASLEKEAKSL